MPRLRTSIVVMDDYGRHEHVKHIYQDLPASWDSWDPVCRNWLRADSHEEALSRYVHVEQEVVE